jgi:hypothetical protein
MPKLWIRKNGRRAFPGRGSGRETERGVLGSENADMSSDKPDENSGRRKPEVSWGRFVLPGLAGS